MLSIVQSATPAWAAAAVAGNVLKPLRRDQRRRAGGVHEVARFERLDPQPALVDARLISGRVSEQPILTGQELGNLLRQTTRCRRKPVLDSMAMHGGYRNSDLASASPKRREALGDKTHCEKMNRGKAITRQVCVTRPPVVKRCGE